jgi:TRAP-type C4-dicarboxylate transport system substrate-binding protein
MVWDNLPEHHRRILSVAMESLALRTALTFEKANAEAAAMLREQGVTVHEWPPEELQKFRNAAQAAWHEFATTPEAEALVESHLNYLAQLGLVEQ